MTGPSFDSVPETWLHCGTPTARNVSAVNEMLICFILTSWGALGMFFPVDDLLIVGIAYCPYKFHLSSPLHTSHGYAHISWLYIFVGVITRNKQCEHCLWIPFQSPLQRLVKRMTRFFVTTDACATVRELESLFEKLGYFWKTNSPGQVKPTFSYSHIRFSFQCEDLFFVLHLLCVPARRWFVYKRW